MAGKTSTNPGLKNIGGAPDRRKDIQNIFSEIGFTDVTGTNGIDTALLGAYARTLNVLERKYGAISASKNPVFTTGNATNGAIAAVMYDGADPSKQIMVINSDYLGQLKPNLTAQKMSESSGHFTKTDGKITSRAGYAITHEYGHMLHNALASRSSRSSDSFTAKAEKEIRSIAKKKYGATSGNVSKYGSTNSKEFFAESFASLNSGSPNPYGKAMGDWLKSNRLK